MGYDNGIMRAKKKPTKHISVKLPMNLFEFVYWRAKKLHGENITAALIEILSKAQEIILEEDAVLALHWIQKFKKQRDKLRDDEKKKELKPKGADQVDKLKKQKERKSDPE